MLEQFLTNKSAELAPHFKPGFLQRELTTFQFLFDSGEPFHLTVTPESFEFISGQKNDPTITLYVIDHETCWGLLEGTLDGMRAFMNGNYRADGNIVLSQLVLYLFKSNDPTLIYEVQD
jgi:putative sterol carrier protein